MVPAFNPMSCPNLAVPAKVMQHVVQIESGGNPFAIGVVGGRLKRQPRNLGEAVATARMLESKGYDYSLGIAQVNRRNLVRYGLDTFPEAFDGCANLAAGAHILASCYGRSGDDWGKAFSCYYSGNFTAGYRDGYVRRIYDAMSSASAADVAEPITVRPQTRERLGETRATSRQTAKPGTPAYRVVMRSIALDGTADALVPSIAQTMDSPDEWKATPIIQPAPETVRLETSGFLSDRAFVPHVSGPADASVTATAVGASTFSGKPFARATADPPPPSDRGTSDAAFVF